MEAWYDRAATYFPCRGVSGDEALPHDGFEDLRQDTLVVGLGVVAQDMSDHHRVRNHDEGLGPEAKLIRRPELLRKEAHRAWAHPIGVRESKKRELPRFRAASSVACFKRGDGMAMFMMSTIAKRRTDGRSVKLAASLLRENQPDRTNTCMHVRTAEEEVGFMLAGLVL